MREKLLRYDSFFLQNDKDISIAFWMTETTFSNEMIADIKANLDADLKRTLDVASQDFILEVLLERDRL